MPFSKNKTRKKRHKTERKISTQTFVIKTKRISPVLGFQSNGVYPNQHTKFTTIQSKRKRLLNASFNDYKFELL